MAKIEHDKYYTPQNIVDLVMKRVEEVVGLENISEFVEPSAGNGAFLDSLYATGIPTKAYDLYPERDDIVEQDYLELNLEHKKGRCVIGNPPFGDRKNNLTLKFLKKSTDFAEHIVFILPIRNLNNDRQFYYYDLIHSENLHIANYSGKPILCCLNIYRIPSNGVIKKVKPEYTLNDVKISEHHRTNKPIIGQYFDYRMCSFGASIGKSCEEDTYCKELCILIINNSHKDAILRILKETNFKKEFPSVSTPYVAVWQVYKYLKEQIPELE